MGNDSKFSNIEYRKQIIYLFLVASILVLFVVNGGARFKEAVFQREKRQASREAQIAVNAFSQHIIQIVKQADVILCSVRMFYQRSKSPQEFFEFIDSLSNETSFVEDIFLVDANGEFIAPDDEFAKGLMATDRDYFRYHQAVADDKIFISAVEKGLVTKKYRFRISRRLNKADGGFGGVVLVTVSPRTFTSYYKDLKLGEQSVVSLVGLEDRLLRARSPEPEDLNWSDPLDSPVWNIIKRTDAGSFEVVSPVDNVLRDFQFLKVTDLPLIMLVGFSEKDIRDRILERKNLLLVVQILSICFIFIVAFFVYRTIEKNMLLQEEILERKRIEGELQTTIDQVRQLEGILPICSFCKKIRNDDGSWERLEGYITRRSEAQFSHSICPECAKIHYPDFVK